LQSFYGGYKEAACRWLDRWSKIDFGEKIIIVMIAVEIFLSIGAIWLTIHEAGLQEEAQQKVVADLATMNLQLGVLNGGITQKRSPSSASSMSE
jgi:hypothetical protein